MKTRGASPRSYPTTTEHGLHEAASGLREKGKSQFRLEGDSRQCLSVSSLEDSRTRGDLVAAEAREWCGTKFVWQASQKGQGCDCKGLVWGVARELNFPEADSFYAKVVEYRPDRQVPAELLKEGMAKVFQPADDIQPGDVLLLRFKGKTQHLAIAVGDGRAVHAQMAPKDWVKETSLRALLRICPLDSVWRWRDVR